MFFFCIISQRSRCHGQYAKCACTLCKKTSGATEIARLFMCRQTATLTPFTCFDIWQRCSTQWQVSYNSIAYKGRWTCWTAFVCIQVAGSSVFIVILKCISIADKVPLDSIPFHICIDLFFLSYSAPIQLWIRVHFEGLCKFILG